MALHQERSLIVSKYTKLLYLEFLLFWLRPAGQANDWCDKHLRVSMCTIKSKIGLLPYKAQICLLRTDYEFYKFNNYFIILTLLFRVGSDGPEEHFHHSKEKTRRSSSFLPPMSDTQSNQMKVCSFYSFLSV